MSKSSFFESNNPFLVVFVRSFENTCSGMMGVGKGPAFRRTRDSKACPRESGGGYPGSSGWGKNLDSRLRGNDDQERQWRKAPFSFFVGERKLMNHFVVKSINASIYENYTS